MFKTGFSVGTACILAAEVAKDLTACLEERNEERATRDCIAGLSDGEESIYGTVGREENDDWKDCDGRPEGPMMWGRKRSDKLGRARPLGFHVQLAANQRGRIA